MDHARRIDELLYTTTIYSYRWGKEHFFSQFTTPKLKPGSGKIETRNGRRKKERDEEAGRGWFVGSAASYTATLCSTLEGTAKRAEKERERFSGSSTHAAPSSKFCA